MTREPFTISRCEHYRGPGVVCHANVDVETTRDRDGRVACCVIRGMTSSIACDLIKLPAPPPAEEGGSMVSGLQALLDNQCPVCGDAKRGELKLSTGEIIAMPCEHTIRGVR